MTKLSKLRLIGCYFSAVIVCIAVIGLSLKGLNLGLDFTGGYVTEFETATPVDPELMQQRIRSSIKGEFRINGSEDNQRWTLRQADGHEALVDTGWTKGLSSSIDSNIRLLDSVYTGTQVGTELYENSGLALLVAAIAIMLYLTLRFEWRLAIGCLVALLHDVLIVLGLFAWLGLSFDLTVLAAILAIIGYSLNDSIIVGDRIRELMNLNVQRPLAATVDRAIKATLTRTLITSGTTLMTIVAIWALAGNPLEGFAIALFTGVIVGSVSSISLSATIPELVGLKADHYHRKAQNSLDNAP